MNKLSRSLAVSCLFILMGMVILAGCRGQQPPAPPGMDLSSTMVPNIDLDAYVYIKQGSPTKIPRSIIGAASDLGVASLAIWGVAQGDDFNFGGALTLTRAADAARIQSAAGAVWTAVAGSTIYFVHGSGVPAERLKSIISKNDFKPFKDEKALTEVAQLPDSGEAKMAGVAILRPSQPILKIISRYAERQTGDMINTLVSAAKLEWITAGLYAPRQIDIADMMQRLAGGSIWEADLGVLASVKSGLPGLLVGPIAGKLLEGAGYASVDVGGLTIYKGSLDAGGGKTVPVFLSLVGDRMFISASAREAYAQTLITGVKR